MPTGDHAHLAAATQRRSARARERARSALSRLDSQGRPVTFASVADAAGVSRALLYRDSDLRHEIERLRQPETSKSLRLPAAQHATESSLARRVENLLDDIRGLRAENHGLREQVAVLLGEQRATTASRAADTAERATS